MKLTTLAATALMAASPAMADLVFPSLSYRTGPYAAGVTAGAVVARLLEAKRGNRIVAKVARHFISQAPVLT